MNAKVLPVLLVALLVAAGAFLFSQRGGDQEPAPVPGAGQKADAAPAGAVVPQQANLTANAAPASTPPAAVAREAVTTASDGKVQEVITLRGRLVDGHAAPRGGVVLALRTWEPMEGVEIENLAPPVGTRARDNRNRPTWTTRPDGTFQIPLARNLVGELDLVTDELVFEKPMAPVAAKKGDRDLGDLVVLREASIAGVVQDERGQPVAGVRVTATVDSIGIGGMTSATTPADGSFKLGMLRQGKWAVRTASGRFLPAVVEIAVAAEEQKSGVVVVVKPGNAIAGQVIDDRGVGVAGIKVGSKRKEASGAVTIERFSPDEATTTDANGYFTLSGLAEETVSVRAFGPGHSPAIAADVAVGTGNLVLRVERCGIVEGVLVGVDGTPIAGSRVRASAKDGGVLDQAAELAEDLLLAGLGGQERAVTAADGTFRLASVRPGNVTVTATGGAHRPVSAGPIAVQPAQLTKGVRLVADLGATARVTVKDEAGKPVAGAKVTADRVEASAGGGNFRVTSRRVEIEDHGDAPVPIFTGDHLGTATTDANGVATIAGLPAVEVSLMAKHDGFAAPAPVKLVLPKTGVTDAALTMRQPGIAEIVVTGSDGAALAGVEVKVAPDGDDQGGEPQNVMTGEGGLARLASLAPGNYTAALTKKRGTARLGNATMVFGNDAGTIAASTQRFTVVAGQTVRVPLQKPVLAKVHGVVTGAEGPAAGCVVELTREDGDAPGLPGFGAPNSTTDADGTFAFDDVEAGRYRLQFGKAEQLVKAQQDLDVPANTAEVRRDLVLRTGKVRVQVVAKGSGEPVSKAEVELVRSEPSSAGGAPRPQRRVMMVSMVMTGNNDGGDGEATSMTVGNQRAFTDEDGIAEIDDVPVGDYTLRIKHKKQAPFEKKDVVVGERQTADLGRIELGTAGLIRGKVATADGKAARMALVTTRAADSQQWSEPVMAQGGSYRVQGLAAGKYKVRAQALGADEKYSPEIEVEVKAGETAQVDLQLPPE